MQAIISDIFGAILSIWLLNLLIDLLFGINVIGYLKVWLDIKLSKHLSKKDDED